MNVCLLLCWSVVRNWLIFLLVCQRSTGSVKSQVLGVDVVPLSGCSQHSRGTDGNQRQDAAQWGGGLC